MPPKSNPTSASSTASAAQSDKVIASSPLPPLKPSNTPTKRRKRPLAKRSCFNCREKKARCELPDIFVPSSQEPVIESKRCHRCSVLDIDCIVWDGDRKRKIKLPQRNPAEDLGHDGPQRNIAANASWSSLSYLASAAEVVAQEAASASQSSQSISLRLRPFSAAATRPSRATSPISSISSLMGYSSETSTATSPGTPDTIFQPSPDIFADSPSTRQTPSKYDADANPVKILTRDPTHSKGDETELSGEGSTSGRPSKQQGPVSPSMVRCQSGSGKEVAAVLRSNDRTWRSVWRPISVILEYAVRQPQYTSYLVQRVASPTRGIEAVDVLDLIDREECLKLNDYMSPYFAWHPHLPLLKTIYDLHARQPTKSTHFLLASMLLVAARHRHPLSSALMRALSSVVDRLGTQMLISATCDILTIQAFELLLAHEPSLIGTSVSGGKDAQASRGNGLAGESLLTTALAISRDIGLDKSLQALHDLLAGPKEKIADGQLSNLFNAASLWISLRLWEGHYIHMKAAIRPIRHFDELAKIAKCMIAIDENGDKVEGTPANLEGFVAGTIESPAQDTEKMIRSAGRTILAYRMQSMAVYQESLAEVQEMITATGDQEHEQAASRAKDKIVEIILGALDMQFYIEQIKQVDMAPYAWHPSASLVEEWSRLESSALFSILCTFGTATLYTGQFDGAFSIKGFVNALRSDEDLRRRISAVGSKRMELSEGLLSSFVFFNRRLTLGAAAAMTTTSNRNPKGLMEVTGAPLLLTSALVVDACRLFLEGAAFVLITYFIIDYKGDIRLSLMVQAAQRLDEFDGNIYLSPARSNPKSRNSRDVSHEEQDDEGGQPLSICRVAAKYTQEIVEAMQRWKLASSVYRRPSSVPAFVPERKLRNEWRRQTKETMSDGEEDSTQRASPTAPVVAAPSVAQPTLTHGLASDCVRDRTAQGSFAMNVDGMSAAQRGRGNITNGSHGGVVFANAAGPWTNIQPLTTEMPFPGHGQAPLSFPFQSWPQDPMSGREHMSVEQLLSGSFPYATQHGTGDFVGGFNDLPLFDSFLDTLFPPH